MNNNSRSNLGRNIIVVLLVIVLCSCVSTVGFFLGRQTVTVETLIPEIVEVTREIPVTPVENTAVQDSPTVPAVEEEARQEPTPVTEQNVEAPTPTPTPVEPPRDLDLDNVNLDLFLEVWGFIASEFDGPVPTESELLYSAINGSLGTLDDEFTRFVPPDVAARMREDLQGSFEGIGAFVRMNDEGFLQIVRPIADQPAAQAGLQAGDLILAVDGVSIVGYNVDEAIALVRGPRGTTVTLTIGRESVDEPFDVAIVRDRIEIPIVEVEMLPDDIAYVRLTSFNRNAEPRLSEAIGDLLAQNPQALIFDLRDNPGGFLDQSVAVADLFLDEGVVLLERNNRGLDEVFRSTDGGIAENIPLVVLVNAGSASASEIVAGAIKDRGRAILIGETTFGKGSVQQSHTLSDGSELRVTIARWYTPDNHSIDSLGISPDIEVLPSPLELGGPDDTQLQRAVEYILTGE